MDLNIQKNIYQLIIKIVDNYLMINIYSDAMKYLNFNIYESYHEIKHTSWGRYVRNNEVRRKIFDLNGNIIDDQYLFENNALMMYDPLLTGN